MELAAFAATKTASWQRPGDGSVGNADFDGQRAHFAFTSMVGCFGLRDDPHPSHFPGDRMVEANARLDVWMLLQCGALTEGALTELKWGQKGSQLARRGPNLLVDGTPVPIVWDEPMEGVGRPWFECGCKRRCRHLYLRQLACRRCCQLDYSSRHLRRQTTTGNTKLFVRNSVISNNTLAGIAIAATGPNRAEIENTSMINNLFGVLRAPEIL